MLSINVMTKDRLYETKLEALESLSYGSIFGVILPSHFNR
jgi:hypothetical protein